MSHDHNEGDADANDQADAGADVYEGNDDSNDGDHVFYITFMMMMVPLMLVMMRITMVIQIT